METKIVQIIPAPDDMYVEWKRECDDDKRELSPIACLALIEVDGGRIVAPMAALGDGMIENVFEFSNFCGIVFGEF